MAQFKLDRIRYTWQGIWTASSSYTKDDIVRFGGNTYVALETHVSDGTDFYQDLNATDQYGNDAPKWVVMTDGVTWTDEWLVENAYKLNDLVKYRGIVYQCITPHTSAQTETIGLEEDQEKWKIVAKTSNWLNLWGPLTDYKLQDIVKYNGILYICIENHTSSTAAAGLEQDQEKWDVLNKSDYWTGEWTAGRRYRKDDVMRYGGNVYRCTVGHTADNTEEEGIEDQDLGTDSTVAKWELVLEGINYRGDWAPRVRYRLNDIVRRGPFLYRATVGHNGQSAFNEDNWTVWMPGIEFEGEWSALQSYQPGDVVVYGGYSYVALTFNTNRVPSVAGKQQDSGDWELLTTGYRLRGDWNLDLDYTVGDVVRVNGYLYVARLDIDFRENTYPGYAGGENHWGLIQTAVFWRGEWYEGTNDDDSAVIVYRPGDLVVDAGTTYICIKQHESQGTFESRPFDDTDSTVGANEYWRIYMSGWDANVLRYPGDIKTYDVTEDGSSLGDARLGIGAPGDVLHVGDSGSLEWSPMDQTDNVYFVSTDGQDRLDYGLSRTAPFRSIRYACQFISANLAERATPQATIIVATGAYEEILPIVVPANTAVVGDELRSTVIQPASGYEQSDMFRMHNGSGLRNCTLQGLRGELGTPNENLTRRPTAGAYVSLDPGTGPDAEYAWISSKSPYVQNVSTFGTGCIGMKVDGDLHNGGNKSIVANDFTQILSDGIGYWVNGDGRSELVSVFTYYCHIGYLATAGGKVRATNGNNSYGLYGSVAEGYDLTEVPKTAQIDNRTKQAQINNLFSNGSSIIGVGYSHCGQEYSTATLSIEGTSANFESDYPEFRQNAISNIRITEEDSFQIGGNNYITVLGNAQAGGKTSITLSGSFDDEADSILGKRIFIRDGKGYGQYARVGAYNDLTRVVTPYKESNGEIGWEHISGRPIAPLLDETTQYLIEPRIIIDPPTNEITVGSIGGSNYSAIGTDGTAVIILSSGSDTAQFSQDGSGFSSETLPASYDWSAVAHDGDSTFALVSRFGNGIVYGNTGAWTNAPVSGADLRSVAFGGGNWYAVGGNTVGDPTDVIFKSAGEPNNWQNITVPVTAEWRGVAYGNGVWVAVAEHGDDSTVGTNLAVYSTDGTNWNSVDLGVTARWSTIIYGYDKFVALSSSDDSTACPIAFSYDGQTWYNETMPTGQYPAIAYQQGLFVTADIGSDRVLISQDGYSWRELLAPTAGNWTGIAAAVGNKWFIVGDTVYNFTGGATAVARASVGGGRIGTMVITNPGSNYTDDPVVSAFDVANTADFTYTVYRNNGVLPQPRITNPGTGYLRSSGSITGDGYAEIFQVSDTINFKNLTALPGPGANVRVNGINDVVYFVTKIVSYTGGAGSFNATIQISPGFGVAEAPEHEEDVTIRELYSQIRLTGHDFLDIGTGNFSQTNYPGLYVFGYESANEPQPFNETVLYDGGRVFYTSTDQDGNFRVGELFEVEQSTGTISINAQFFDLGGLDELRLGGVVLGGTGAVIREFSTDPTFAANSNNIVPTQKAIATYIESRLASGGADPKVNRLNAGEVSVFGNEITVVTGAYLQMNASTKISGTASGTFTAQTFFAHGGAFEVQDTDIAVADIPRTFNF